MTKHIFYLKISGRAPIAFDDLHTALDNLNAVRRRGAAARLTAYKPLTGREASRLRKHASCLTAGARRTIRRLFPFEFIPKH